MRYFFVVNPNARNGLTGRIWPRIESQIKSRITDYNFRLTTRPLEAIEIAREATQEGYDIVVSVGGDGTNNEALNGILSLKDKITNLPALGFIPQGTGGDFRRTVGLTPDIEKSIEILKSCKRRRIDVGLIRYLDREKVERERYFLNICSFGISGLVDYYVNHTTKIFGGKVSFLIGTIRGIFNYRNIPADITVDGRNMGRFNITLVAVANGRYFGGSMMVAPEAEIDDGLFDIVVMKDISRLRFIRDGSKIYKGQHIIPPNVFVIRGKELAVQDGGLYIDLDGEDVGTTPATFKIIEKAIDIIVA